MHGSPQTLSADDRGPGPLLHSVPKVAELLSVTPRYVWLMIDRGELKSVKIGTRRLVPAEDLREFINRLREDEAQASATARADPAPARRRKAG